MKGQRKGRKGRNAKGGREAKALSALPPFSALLLECDLRPCRLQLLLGFLGFCLRNALLDHLRSCVNLCLGLRETESGHLADSLDDSDLLSAGLRELNVVCTLFFYRLCCGTATCGDCN